MKIQHESPSMPLNILRQLHRVSQAVHIVARIHPNAEPKTGPAMFHKNGQGIAGLIAIPIDTTAPFNLGKRGNVRSQIKLRT